MGSRARPRAGTKKRYLKPRRGQRLCHQILCTNTNWVSLHVQPQQAQQTEHTTTHESHERCVEQNALNEEAEQRFGTIVQLNAQIKSTFNAIAIELFSDKNY